MGLFDGYNIDGSGDTFQSPWFQPQQFNLPGSMSSGDGAGSDPLYGSFGSPSPQDQGSETSDAMMEASILQQFGIKPENLQLDDTGHIRMSPADRRMAMGAAMEALGAGISAGAMSGSWGGIGMGMSQGMANAGKAYRSERDSATERKQKGELTKIEAAKGVSSIQSAEFNLKEAKKKAAEEDAVKEAVKKNIAPIVSDMQKRIATLQPRPDENPSAFEDRKNVMRAKLDYASALFASGTDAVQALTLFSDVTNGLPGVQEDQAKWMSNLQGLGEGTAAVSKQKVTNASVEKTAATTPGTKTELDAEGNVTIVTPDKRLGRAAVAANTEESLARADALAFGGPGGTKEPLTEGEIAASIHRVDTERATLEGASSSITKAASRVREFYARNKSGDVSKLSDMQLLQQAFSDGSDINKTLGSSVDQVAAALGVDPTQSGMDPKAKTKDANFRLQSIVANLEKAGVEYSSKSGKFFTGNSEVKMDPDSIASIVSSREKSMMGAVNPSAEDRTFIRDKVKSTVGDSLEEYIKSFGTGDRARRQAAMALSSAQRGKADEMVNAVMVAMGRETTGPEAVALERTVLQIIREEIAAYK